jgi:hypothetical protein
MVAMAPLGFPWATPPDEGSRAQVPDRPWPVRHLYNIVAGLRQFLGFDDYNAKSAIYVFQRLAE